MFKARKAAKQCGAGIDGFLTVTGLCGLPVDFQNVVFVGRYLGNVRDYMDFLCIRYGSGKRKEAQIIPDTDFLNADKGGTTDRGCKVKGNGFG